MPARVVPGRKNNAPVRLLAPSTGILAGVEDTVNTKEKTSIPEIITDLDEINIEKELTNVVQLKTIPGGKEPTDPNDWLSSLDKGTAFLVRDKSNPRDFAVYLFWLEDKISNKTVVLRVPQAPQNLYVYPLTFCARYSLHETLCVFDLPTQEEQQETGEDHDGDRLQGERSDPKE